MQVGFPLFDWVELNELFVFNILLDFKIPVKIILFSHEINIGDLVNLSALQNYRVGVIFSIVFFPQLIGKLCASWKFIGLSALFNFLLAVEGAVQPVGNVWLLSSEVVFHVCEVILRVPFKDARCVSGDNLLVVGEYIPQIVDFDIGHISVFSVFSDLRVAHPHHVQGDILQ